MFNENWFFLANSVRIAMNMFRARVQTKKNWLELFRLETGFCDGNILVSTGRIILSFTSLVLRNVDKTYQEKENRFEEM